MRSVNSLLAAAGAAVLITHIAAADTTIVEHFNDYGEDRQNLMGLGEASGGWGGPWAENFRPDYLPGVQLNYSNAYYNNLPNLHGATHGLATYQLTGTGSGSGQHVRRDIAAPMTGTVWVSTLVHLDGPVINPDTATQTAPDVIFWFNANLAGVNSHNYIGLRSVVTDNTDPTNLEYFVSSSARYASSTPLPYRGTFAEGVVHLIVAKVEIDVNLDGHDNLSFWVNPDISNGESGLGQPLWEFSGTDAYPSLSSIGVSFTGPQSQLDSIRISNAPDGFRQVTLLGAPDPVPGDANRDGKVDIADLSILASNWQQSDAYWERGDFTGEGVVNIADLSLLASNWQHGVAGSTMSLAEALAMFDVFNGVAIPEPAAGTLLGVVALLGVRRRR